MQTSITGLGSLFAHEKREGERGVMEAEMASKLLNGFKCLTWAIRGREVCLETAMEGRL